MATPYNNDGKLYGTLHPTDGRSRAHTAVRNPARGRGKTTAFLLAFLLSGCSVPQALPGGQAVNSSVLITADPTVVLTNQRVEIRTEPAPSEIPPAPGRPRAESSEPPATVPAQAPLPSVAAAPATGHAWIQETMAKYGVYPEAGTQFVIGQMPAGCERAHGCTQFRYYPDTGVAFDYTITIRPDQLTEYLLLHEIGHARGIRDECGADNFARSVLGPVPGHYC